MTELRLCLQGMTRPAKQVLDNPFAAPHNKSKERS